MIPMSIDRPLREDNIRPLGLDDLLEHGILRGFHNGSAIELPGKFRPRLQNLPILPGFGDTNRRRILGRFFEIT